MKSGSEKALAYEIETFVNDDENDDIFVGNKRIYEVNGFFRGADGTNLFSNWLRSQKHPSSPADVERLMVRYYNYKWDKI